MSLQAPPIPPRKASSYRNILQSEIMHNTVVLDYDGVIADTNQLKAEWIRTAEVILMSALTLLLCAWTGYADSPQSFPTGIYRNPPSAEEQQQYVYFADFENRDDVESFRDYGKSCTVDFKGLTEEHAFSGKKSFKLDVTFGKPGRYIWTIRMKPAVTAARKAVSGYMLIGKESTTAKSSLVVSYSYPPTSVTCWTGIREGYRTTEGKWKKIELGKTNVDDLGRGAETELDGFVEEFAGCLLSREDITPAIDHIRLDIRAKRPGDRIVIYLDDIGLESIEDRRIEVTRAAHPSDAFRQRYRTVLSRHEEKINSAKEIMAGYKWTEQMEWVKEALHAGVEDAEEFLQELAGTIPFGVAPLARLEDQVARLTDTVNSLAELKQGDHSSHIVYAVDELTSKNFWINPFDVLVPGAVAKRVSLTACRGEYEPASFVVKARKGLKQLRVECSDLSMPDGSARIPSRNVDIKLIKCWYQAGTAGVRVHQRDGRTQKRLIPELLVNDDSLVMVDYEKQENYLKLTFPDRIDYRWISTPEPVDRASLFLRNCPVKDSDVLLPVDVPAGKNQQFWITVRIPDGIPAGEYAGNIRLLADDTTIDHLDFTVRVLSFELSQPYYTASIDTHANLRAEDWVSICSYAKSKATFLAELQNMAKHGLSNCQHYFTMEDLRPAMELRAQAGMDNKTVYLKGHRINLCASTPEELEEVKTKARTIIAIAQEYGTEVVYFYGRDEKTGKNLVAQRKAWEAIREVGGRIFVAGGRDNLALMGDIQDMVVKEGWPDRKHVEGWHARGQKIFSYANPQIGVENPETYRRNFGLLMWKYEYDGIANNAYQQNFGFVWNDFDHNYYRSHTIAYPTVDGVVDTIAWEGFREGIDDVRYMTTLEKLIRTVGQSAGKNDAAVANAERFVAELKSSETILTESLDIIRKRIIEHIQNIHNR